MKRKEKVNKNKKFHQNLKKLLRQKKLSMTQLSKDTGIPVSRLEIYQHCVVEPGPFDLIRLANYFKVSKEVLCGRKC